MWGEEIGLSRVLRRAFHQRNGRSSALQYIMRNSPFTPLIWKRVRNFILVYHKYLDYREV